MWGAIIGAAVSAAGSILGGHKASKAMRKAKASVEREKAENRNWYDRRYNEDLTQRADAQRILSQTEAAFKRRNLAAQGSAAVIGGTEEGVAATKAANAMAMADATSRIAAHADARKDQIEEHYRSQDKALDKELANIEVGKANAIGQAVQGVSSAAASLGQALDDNDVFKKKDTSTVATAGDHTPANMDKLYNR